MEIVMKDYITFDKMITPLIIRVLFWVFAVLAVIGGFVMIVGGMNAQYGGGGMVFGGVMYILLGPVVARIYCEILIVIFKINGTLTEIRDSLKSSSNDRVVN
tara:strand:+ start:212 stop:517 length:306 start_codon:yes stop_codon:yes gene_type:complete